MFDVLDCNSDGLVDIDDLVRVFDKLGWNERFDPSRVLDSLDYDKDGVVNFEGKNSLKNPNFGFILFFFPLF